MGSLDNTPEECLIFLNKALEQAVSIKMERLTKISLVTSRGDTVQVIREFGGDLSVVVKVLLNGVTVYSRLKATPDVRAWWREACHELWVRDEKISDARREEAIRQLRAYL